MTWPATNPTKVHLDQTSDDPSLARAELASLVDAVVTIIGGRGTADGVCELDASGLIPTTRYTTFPAGFKMAAFQDAAPTGWSIVTTLEDYMMRVVKGSVAGGGTGGATGGTESPINLSKNTADGGAHPGLSLIIGPPIGTQNVSITGGVPVANSAHIHTGTTAALPNHAHAISWTPKYANFIIIQKS